MSFRFGTFWSTTNMKNAVGVSLFLIYTKEGVEQHLKHQSYFQQPMIIFPIIDIIIEQQTFITMKDLFLIP